MKTLKTIIVTVALVASAALVITGIVEAQSSFNQQQSSQGIQRYQGEFDGYYMYPSNNAAGGLIWYQIPVPAYIPQNAAPSFDYTNSSQLTAPASLPPWGTLPNNGTVFTNPPVETLLTVSVVLGADITMGMTNLTTGATYVFGAASSSEVNTIRLGPNEHYQFGTNLTTGFSASGTSIYFDELRN